jgi:hypothetical protein
MPNARSIELRCTIFRFFCFFIDVYFNGRKAKLRCETELSLSSNLARVIAASAYRTGRHNFGSDKVPAEKILRTSFQASADANEQ